MKAYEFPKSTVFASELTSGAYSARINDESDIFKWKMFLNLALCEKNLLGQGFTDFILFVVEKILKKLRKVSKSAEGKLIQT